MANPIFNSDISFVQKQEYSYQIFEFRYSSRLMNKKNNDSGLSKVLFCQSFLEADPKGTDSENLEKILKWLHYQHFSICHGRYVAMEGLPNSNIYNTLLIINKN